MDWRGWAVFITAMGIVLGGSVAWFFQNVSETESVLTAVVIVLGAATITLACALWSEHQDKKSREEERQASNRDDDPVPVTVVDALLHEGRANREEHERQEEKKGRREWITVFLVTITAGFVILQWNEMTRVYGPINASATAAKTQAEANRDQVAILKNQLRANLKVRIEQGALNRGQENLAMIFTPVWTNAGGTDASQASGWDDIEFFESGIPSNFDFLNRRSTGVGGSPISVTQGDQFMQETKALTAAQIKKIGEQQAQAIIWGYMEYRDVFPNTPLHHVRYCLKVFPANVSGLISFPLYSRECNTRD